MWKKGMSPIRAETVALFVGTQHRNCIKCRRSVTVKNLNYLVKNSVSIRSIRITDTREFPSTKWVQLAFYQSNAIAILLKFRMHNNLSKSEAFHWFIHLKVRFKNLKEKNENSSVFFQMIETHLEQIATNIAIKVAQCTQKTVAISSSITIEF